MNHQTGMSKSSLTRMQTFSNEYVEDNAGGNTDTSYNISASVAASNPNPYVGIYGVLASFPTRTDPTNIMFTWHHEMMPNFQSVVSVRQYVTTTDPENVRLNSTWSMGSSNPFSNTMPNSTILSNTLITSSAQPGELYRSWVESGYYVLIAIQYYTAGNKGHIAWAWTERTTSNVKASAPSLSYDQSSRTFTVGTSMSGRRVLEFYNTDNQYGYPTSITSEETLNEMYYTSLVDMEYWDNPYRGYYNLSGKKLNRWAPGRYTVGVQFNDPTNQAQISNAINAAINEINGVLNSFGVYFTRSGTTGDINIVVDTEYNLFGIDLSTDISYAIGGLWYTYPNLSGEIIEARIELANDYYSWLPFQTYESVAMEELLQSMGAGYDQVEYPFGTIHTDFNYHNKPAYITAKDRDILRLLYSDYVSPNDSYTDVALSLNIPKGCYMPTTDTTNSTLTVPDSFLKKGGNYRVRAFVVNSSGGVSATGNWINVSINDRPNNFSWTYAKTQGGDFNLTAGEWNSYTARINEFRDYRGLSPYSFTTAYTGNPFTAGMYNQARSAIQSISGFGGYIPQVSSGQDITAYMMNILVSELNAIP